MSPKNSENNIVTFSDKGSYSHCCIINAGEIVFKFKKRPGVNYENEAKILNLLKDENLGVKIQTVGWSDHLSDYIGLYGIKGKAINELKLTEPEKSKIANTLADFIIKLHNLNFSNVNHYNLSDEIKTWHERFARALPILEKHFSESEIKSFEQFVYYDAPKRLKELGEKSVFSHGDLWENNIFLTPENEVGIIDFSDAGYYDEAAELMYLEDDELCEKILDRLKADKTLREKVKLRRTIKNLFIISASQFSENHPALKSYATKIKTTIML